MTQTNRFDQTDSSYPAFQKVQVQRPMRL